MDDSVITREVNWEHGETAVTHYERLAVSNGYSLVELHLDTGRTHQIRVHMKYIGCPLPGDFLYHPVFDRISRQALHSFQLEFCHPITKKLYVFWPLYRKISESICRKKPVKINKHKKTAALCALHSLHTDSCFAISVNYLFFS